LIEKDLYLQSLLVGLSNNNYFSENFAFKGGTCLTKCYLGYYRFSEDIDFSWINQGLFVNKTEKKIRKDLSAEISRLSSIIKEAAVKIGLDFKEEKNNKRYIEFGGSNKFVTFKLWYKSIITDIESFIKIQVNFVEKFLFKFSKPEISSIIKDIDTKEINFLFKENGHIITSKPTLNTYDIKEIIIEKFRAILTRQGIKSRDFIDLYKISKKTNIFKFKKESIEKIRFMLKYEKYKVNLKNKQKDLESGFKIGEESYLLLGELEEDFYIFVDKAKEFLFSLLKELS